MFDDPAAMLADFRLDDLAPMGQQAEVGAFLVGGHQPRIAGDIGGEDCRQPTFDTLLIARLASAIQPKTPQELCHPGRKQLDRD
jgi:hypothetical protein